MSVKIEGNVGQASAASGWHQNGRVVSAQEKEKDAPQPFPFRRRELRAIGNKPVKKGHRAELLQKGTRRAL